jgi:LPXTG-motif cell wall-anchored protein
MGAGSASAADSFTISGTLGTALRPGIGGALDLTIGNPLDVQLRLNELTVTVASVAPTTCAVSNFAVNQAVLPTIGLTAVPAHGALSLSAVGLTISQLPQVRMVETGVSQDECQNAVLHLVYTGSALAAGREFPGGGDNGDGHDHDHDHDHDGSGDESGSELPHTGGSGHESGMTAAGLGFLAAGAAITRVVRRRKGVDA